MVLCFHRISVVHVRLGGYEYCTIVGIILFTDTYWMQIRPSLVRYVVCSVNCSIRRGMHYHANIPPSLPATPPQPGSAQAELKGPAAISLVCYGLGYPVRASVTNTAQPLTWRKAHALKLGFLGSLN